VQDFRVKFKLDDETARLFKDMENKPEIVAEAIKWYLSFGRETLQKLERIEYILVSGVRLSKNPKEVEVKRDEIDDAFDAFVI